MRDNTREFHLEPVSAGRWNLYAAHTERFTHDAAQAEATKWTFQNPHAAQRLQWVVRVAGQRPVKGVTVEINGKPALTLDERAVPAGGALRYTGGSEALVCDSNLERNCPRAGGCRGGADRLRRSTSRHWLSLAKRLESEDRTAHARPGHDQWRAGVTPATMGRLARGSQFEGETPLRRRDARRLKRPRALRSQSGSIEPHSGADACTSRAQCVLVQRKSARFRRPSQR